MAWDVKKTPDPTESTSSANATSELTIEHLRKGINMAMSQSGGWYGGGPEQRLINPPIPVTFSGWQSNTAELYRNGWRFWLYEMDYGSQWAFKMRHEALRMAGYSARMDRNDAWALNAKYNPASSESEKMARMYGKFPEAMQPVQVSMGSQLQLTEVEQLKYVPMEPQFLEMPATKEGRFSIWDLFVPDAGEEILVGEKDVGKMLDKILDSQKPKQEELRKRCMREKKKGHLEVIKPDASQVARILKVV